MNMYNLLNSGCNTMLYSRGSQRGPIENYSGPTEFDSIFIKHFLHLVISIFILHQGRIKVFVGPRHRVILRSS